MDKVETIQNCPWPLAKKDVQPFLGLVGWYRRFVLQFSTIATPLTAFTVKDQKNPITWSEECPTAFDFLKKLFVLFTCTQETKFYQKISGPGGCSRPWSSPGPRGRQIRAYSPVPEPQTQASLDQVLTVEKKGLVIKWALESLHYYLLGQECDLETDPRALMWINSMKDYNSRLTRWYLSLQPFKFIICHQAGKLNVVVDYLSSISPISRRRRMMRPKYWNKAF